MKKIQTSRHAHLPGAPGEQFQLKFSELNISRKHLIRTLGYSNGSMPEYYREKIQQILQKAENLTTVVCGYRLLEPADFQWQRDGFWVKNDFFQTGKIIAANLRRSTTIIFFAATAGSVFDYWSAELFSAGEFPDGLAVDTVGSEIAESAADWLENHLTQIYADYDLKLTNRYSPGYCGWSVAEQHQFFSYFPPGFCSISLRESGLMVPLKSVSGAIGIGHHVKKTDYSCNMCNMQNCYRRKESVL
ncbi:MAG: hypothetical protein WAN36_14130 [Calditrichia bacterium]